MEFVAADDGSAAAEHTVRQKPRRAVAEMQLPAGEARCMAEQSGHGVAPPRRILEALAQNHVAAAFAMHRARLGKAPQPCGKSPRGGERIGVQLRISAGQPAAIGTFGRRLVGERRKCKNLGAGATPRLNEVRINEAEGLIAGQRDALARRRQGRDIYRSRHRSGRHDRRRARNNGVEIEMALGRRGEAVDQRGEFGVLAGLDEAEVALRQRQRGSRAAARRGREHRARRWRRRRARGAVRCRRG